MEELYVLAVLLCSGLAAEEEYEAKLHELFLENETDKQLLYLESETDLKQAMGYILSHVDLREEGVNKWGKAMMKRLKVRYAQCCDLACFADELYRIWSLLPDEIAYKKPFCSMNYAGDDLSSRGEAYARRLCEEMIDYYMERKE